MPKSLYLEGYSGSSTFRDVELKATWSNFNDFVKTTVFEVDLTGRFAYGSQAEDNSKKHWMFLSSSEKNGRISWDDANADGTKGDNDPNCHYFCNCMECRGTVYPSGVTNEVAFDMIRYKWARVWDKLKDANDWGDPKDDSTPWTPDEVPDNADEDLTVSVYEHIYQIDGPGFMTKLRTPTYDCCAYIGNFKEWVKVEIDGDWYQCSDYYKWYSKCYTEDKNDTEMTRAAWGLQQLGAGWITVPDSP